METDTLFIDGKNQYPKGVISPFNAIPLKIPRGGFCFFVFFMIIWQADSKIYAKKCAIWPGLIYERIKN